MQSSSSRTHNLNEVSILTPDQVAALAASGESETLELKETTGTRQEAAMTVQRVTIRIGRRKR